MNIMSFARLEPIEAEVIREIGSYVKARTDNSGKYGIGMKTIKLPIKLTTNTNRGAYTDRGCRKASIASSITL